MVFMITITIIDHPCDPGESPVPIIIITSQVLGQRNCNKNTQMDNKNTNFLSHNAVVPWWVGRNEVPPRWQSTINRL